MRRSLLAAASSFLASTLLLTGCSTSFAPGPVTPVQTAFGNIGGYVHGGQQPIVGAAVRAYGTSTTAYGGVSTLLASTTTDGNGYFTFPASTTCTENTVVYLYSLGGQPTTGVTNTAAGLMAVLGTCPAGGLLDESISGGSTSVPVQIYMNEVSTVAAAYALAGFAINSSNVSTSATSIGALTTSDTLAQTGIQNAAANAAQMYTAVATNDGGAANNGSTRAANLYTPGSYSGGIEGSGTLSTTNFGTVPQELIDTIANILAACVNSTGPGSSPCTTLFNDDRSGGGQTGAEATDTATAALYLAQHPYSAYVTTLYNLVGSTANPFAPALTAAPTSFIVELLFSGGGVSNAPGLDGYVVQNIAIDGSGNVWTANTAGGAVSKFSPLGVSLAGATGYSPAGCGDTASTPPVSIAINAASTEVLAGITNRNDVAVLTTAGACISEIPVDASDGDGDGPYGIAIDSSGNAWVTNDNGGQNASVGQLYELALGGFLKINSVTGNGMVYPLGIAIEPAGGDIWVGNFGVYVLNSANIYDSVFTSTGASASFSPSDGGNANIIYGAGMAIDSNGYVWTAVSNSPGGLGKISSTGTGGAYYPQNAANVPAGIAIDGAGNVWYGSNSYNGKFSSDDILEVNNSGVLLAPSTGYIPITDTSGNIPDPDGVAIDGSGNLWYTIGEASGSPLRAVGAAVPVATPIAYGVANSKLGTRP